MSIFNWFRFYLKNFLYSLWLDCLKRNYGEDVCEHLIILDLELTKQIYQLTEIKQKLPWAYDDVSQTISTNF